MSVKYFMDECTEYEMNDIMENIPYADRNLWVSQRLIAYLISKANFKDIKKFSDVMTLPFDNEDKGDTEITNKQIEDVKAFAKKHNIV